MEVGYWKLSLKKKTKNLFFNPAPSITQQIAPFFCTGSKALGRVAKQIMTTHADEYMRHTELLLQTSTGIELRRSDITSWDTLGTGGTSLFCQRQ